MTRAKDNADTHLEQSEHSEQLGQHEHSEQLGQHEHSEQLEQVVPPAHAAKSGWPKFLKSTTAFGYTDPYTHIHYGPAAGVRVDAAPKVGSWLHSQMAAKLIGEA